MIDQLLPSYECGQAQSRRDVTTWLVIAVLAAVCAVCVTLAAIMLPGPTGPGSELVEAPIPAGTWAVEWTPTMQLPGAEQQQQVRALRYVSAGTLGLLSGLCFLVVAALWGQRLRLRRNEHFSHWAVGATRWQLIARLIGEARFWAIAAVAATVLGTLAVVGVVEHTFPGEAALSVNARAYMIVLTGFAVALTRWERLAASGPIRSSPFHAYQLLGSPAVVGAVGVSILCGVGLLVLHSPYSGLSSTQPDGMVVHVSLPGLSEDARRQRILDLTETVAATGQRVGLASAGTVRGAGHWDVVSTECGRCFEGGLPMPLKYVRAEMHAVAQDTFTHLGIQVTRGRDFDDQLDTDMPSVAIVSQALANRHFERGEAVGRRVRVGYGGWLTVVGVVEDATDLRNHAEYTVYVPVAAVTPTELEVLIPQSGSAAEGLAEFTALSGVVAGPRTRSEVFAVHRWFRGLVAAVGVAAMLVLAAGLWVSAANEATAIQFEVGLRRAVGAQSRNLRRLYAGLLARRLGAAIVAGAWLSLFLGAGLGKAYGAIPQIDGLVLASAGAWVALMYLLGSLKPFVRACRAPLIDSLNAAA